MENLRNSKHHGDAIEEIEPKTVPMAPTKIRATKGVPTCLAPIGVRFSQTACQMLLASPVLGKACIAMDTAIQIKAPYAKAGSVRPPPRVD